MTLPSETLYTEIKEKTCTKCGLPKPLTSFHKYKRSQDGVRSVCKWCRSTRKPQVPKIPIPPPDFKVCKNQGCILSGMLQTNTWLSHIESEWIMDAILYLRKYDTDLSHIEGTLSACHLPDRPVTTSD